VGEFAGTAGGPLAALGPGSRVAGYRLEYQVGAGGMAVVFSAHDERLNRRVAVKLLAPALAADEGFRRRFLRESQAAAAVDDPHIIPVYEAGEADGVLFIAMRYVPGGDVRSLISRSGPLPPARVDAIISPVASALDAAHMAGLVHRDVKPGNMLLDTRPGRPDHVYLTDFGLSKVALDSAGLTADGKFLGTADYISPEQIQDGPVDGRADQYALACMAFALLTGAPPFRRGDAMAVLHAHVSQPPPRLTTRRPDLPAAADEVFAIALAKDSADRYESCQAFADALADGLGLPPHDFGTGKSAALTHPPTEFAWSPPLPGAAAAAGDPDLAAAADAFLHGALTTSAPLANPGPLPPRRGDTHGPGRSRPRREVVIAVAAAVVVLAGAAAAGVRLLAPPAPARLGVQLAASSALPAAGDAVYVRYRGGQDASARISGHVSDAKSGEVARLYAQPFPYHQAPALAGALTLHPAGASASYSFQVTPAIATRYRVELLKNSAAARPLATSEPVTVYVTADAITSSPRKCHRPLCHQTFRVRVRVPPSALATEIAQRWRPYFGLRHAAAQQPPTPQLLVLGAGTARVSRPHRISGGEFGWAISFSFPVGQRGYAWNWAACIKTSEATDGIGLPGPSGCGSARIRASAPGMLASPCARYLACAAAAPGVRPAPPAQTPGTSPSATQQPSSRSSHRTPRVKPVVTVHNPGSQTGTAGVAISKLQITATDSAGKVLTYSATLPPGLAIAATGLISGTPKTAGTYTATVTATDTSGHRGHVTFTWTIGGTVLTCNSPGDQIGTVGDAVSSPITCTDSAGLVLTYSATLPPGLAINAATGLITGTPTAAGTYTATVTATDTSGSKGSCSFTWTVGGASTPAP
jgi:Protein kinase domain/Putative Ig domain